MFLLIKIRKNIKPNVTEKYCEEKHVDLSLIGKERKSHYVLIKYVYGLCMIIHYIVKEDIFAVIVYKLLVQKKDLNVILNTSLKLIAYKIL